MPAELKQIAQVVPQLNPVIVLKVEKYDLLMLASLTIHTKERIEQFEAIIKSMQSDYQEMYNSITDKPLLITAHGFSSEVQYCDRYVTSQLTGYQSDIAQISMAIQKSKYDGSEQVFKDWVIRLGNSPVDEKSEKSQ